MSSNERTSAVVSSSSSSLSAQKSVTNKQLRCSSRSDSRSTNTSSSTVSDTVHEYPSVSTSSSSSNISMTKKDSLISNDIHRKASDHFFRALYNGNTQSMFPSSFQSFTTSYMKQPLLFPHHRPLPISIPSSFDFRRLQSSCIFCHEQFSELNHLLQHIRKNHAVTSSTNNNNTTLTLDKIIF